MGGGYKEAQSPLPYVFQFVQNSTVTMSSEQESDTVFNTGATQNKDGKSSNVSLLAAQLTSIVWDPWFLVRSVLSNLPNIQKTWYKEFHWESQITRLKPRIIET